MVHWFAWKQVKRNVGKTVKWREQQQKIFVVRLWNFAQNKNFRRADCSGPKRPGMTLSLKQLLADCFKTSSGRPEDWTVSGPCHLQCTTFSLLPAAHRLLFMNYGRQWIQDNFILLAFCWSASKNWG